MRILSIILLVGLFSAGLGACGFIGFPGVYRIDVEQGNIVTQDMADQLEPGMSRRQVRFILGTPLVEDTFNGDRWDYPYVIRRGLEVREQSALAVIFDGDSLQEVRGDYLPPAWQTAEQKAAAQNARDEAAADDAETLDPFLRPAQDAETADANGEDPFLKRSAGPDDAANADEYEQDSSLDDANASEAAIEGSGEPEAAIDAAQETD